MKQIRAIAKRDANNNLKRLEELLELRRKKAQKKEGEKQGEDGAQRQDGEGSR
jgi:hypothetical protein